MWIVWVSYTLLRSNRPYFLRVTWAGQAIFFKWLVPLCLLLNIMLELLSVVHENITSIIDVICLGNKMQFNQAIILPSLFLFSSSSFLPSLLLPLLVKNLSFFQKVEVCWNKATGSFFFFLVTAGLLYLKV